MQQYALFQQIQKELRQPFSRAIEDLKVELNKKQNEINSLKNSITERDQKLEALSNKVDKLASDMGNKLSGCITDIKVGNEEVARAWKGYGYRDEAGKGFLITGVSNDGNELIDNVHRRQVLMRRGGNWTPLHA